MLAKIVEKQKFLENVGIFLKNVRRSKKNIDYRNIDLKRLQHFVKC
jgi:hypothetical protein